MSKAKPIIQKGPAEGEVITHLSFLDSVMEQSPFAMWISDVKGTVIRTNGALRQTLDLTDDRIVGKYNVLEDDNLKEQGVMNQVRTVFEDRRTARFSIPWIPGKAGNVDFRGARALWIDVSIFPVVNGDGKLTHVVCQWIDITERKQKENALRVSEEKYRDLVENMVDVIFTLDTTGQVTSINPSVKAMLGFEPEEVIGRHFMNWIPPDQQAVIMPIFKRILAGETIIDETVLIGKDGKPRDAEFRASCISRDGQVVGVQGILRDITERKKADADLRESEKRFQQVVENAGDWIWEVDTEGLYTYASPVVENILGYKPEEIVGKKHFYDFFASEVKEDLKKGAFEAFAKRENFEEFVNPNIHKNGSAVILETSGTPIIDEQGNLCGYRGADRDITERTRRENELRKLNADLVLASRRAGMAEVATDVLHNVGNVLNSINVSASFIQDKVANSKAATLKKVIDILAAHTDNLETFLTEDERGRHIPLYLTEAARFILEEQNMVTERLQSLTKNVEHLKHIIQAQQSYARSGGKEVLSNIDEVIEDAVEINHAALDRYGIDLYYELAELPEVRMDKQRVLQILVNLISNAKEALTESKNSEKVLAIRSYKHVKDRLCIEVSDNGVGISEENMSKIFTHGFTTKKKGHGFGLHSSAVAAREMGGSLTVQSDGPGLGATFKLELPFCYVDVPQ